ncbi:hypothetical protein OROGR_033952 [Orobanche gracilis]
MENKTRILYNDNVDQLKGCGASLVARLFWVQNVTGSNPVIPTAPFGSNEESIEIDLSCVESVIL